MSVRGPAPVVDVGVGGDSRGRGGEGASGLARVIAESSLGP